MPTDNYLGQNKLLTQYMKEKSWGIERSKFMIENRLGNGKGPVAT